jgi:uncharacterized protein (DUF885 family)
VVRQVEYFAKGPAVPPAPAPTADGLTRRVLRAPADWVRCRMALETTAYHGVPGHHLQLAIRRELTGVPRILTGGTRYNAFSEGWGLYSEPLAKEMGFYQDPYSDFGRLSLEQWRAVRLVVDTGMHAKGWTEDEAVNFFLDNVPMPEAAARSEVQRYLTARARRLVQNRHDRDSASATKRGRSANNSTTGSSMSVGVGAVPLPVLEVGGWIDAQGMPPGSWPGLIDLLVPGTIVDF